jgi:hypothetical protein
MGKFLKRFQLGRKNKVSKGNKKLEIEVESIAFELYHYDWIII